MVDTKRTIDNDAVPPGGIPLDLAPLLTPFKDHKRLSVRVERLPPKARLSAGHNNGDGTWSLGREELPGLHYLPPEGLADGHTLEIRIVSLDGESATTLTQIDLPVSLYDEAEAASAVADTSENNVVALSASMSRARKRARVKFESAPAPEDEPIPDAASKAGDDNAAALAAAFEERLTDLSRQLEEARRAASESEAERARIVEELEKRHTEALEAAAGQASKTLEESRAAWTAERDQLITRVEADNEARIEEAVAAARETWKAEEAARLSAAETHWQAQAKRDLADVTARYKKAEAALVDAHKHAMTSPDANKDAELRRLRDTLAATQAELTDRDNAVAELRKEIERVKKEKTGPVVDAELAKARKAWTRELEDRLADAAADAEAKLEKARAAWQKETDDRLAEAAEQYRERIDQAERRGQAEADAAMSDEREAWKAEEAARLTEAEARWRKKSDKALADATARYEKAEAALADASAKAQPTHHPDDVTELQRLRDALSAAEGTVSDRDAALAKASARVEKAEAALADARVTPASTRDPDDIAELRRLRDALAAAESKVSERDAELADASGRVERAESALADASRARRDAGRDPEDVAELRRLRDALATAQASLSERDSELAEAHAAVDKARQGLDAEIDKAVREAEEEWKALEGKRIWAARIQWRKEAQSAQARAAVTKLAMTRRRWPSLRYLWRVGFAMAAIGLVLVLYPYVESMISKTLGPDLGTITSKITGP